MSSQTVTAFEATSSATPGSSARRNREVVVHGVALIVSVLPAVYQAHAWHALWIPGTASVALFCANLFPQRFPEVQASPLEIDRAVRLLRGLIFSAAIVAGCALMSPSAGVSVLRVFFCFVFALAILRTTIRVRPVKALPLVSLQAVTQQCFVFARVKRALDAAFAAMALIVFSPLLLLVAIAVKVDSPGPVLFSQQRVGYRGRRFRIFKFRSMRVNVPKYQRSPSTLDDARITRVGRLLRRLSLDELPQLINVLRGEMSFVGPRPEMPYIANGYNALQRSRLDAIPGITGLWQISPARAFPIHEHMEYDLYYIAHQSLLLDLAILCRTTTSVLQGIGAA